MKRNRSKSKSNAGSRTHSKPSKAKEDKILGNTNDIKNTVKRLESIGEWLQSSGERFQSFIEKTAHQDRTRWIFGCVLTVAVAFFPVWSHQQPFTATVKVHGWKGESHIPLKGKGHIKITLGDKPDRSPINADGEAIFRQVPPMYDGRDVPIEIDDTGDEPWHLVEKSVRLGENRTGLVEVRLRGL